MTVMVDVPGRLLTLDDVTRIAEEDPDHRYELIEGNLVTMPPGNVRHQRIILRIGAWLLAHEDPERVIVEPGVRTAKDCLNGRIPDVVVTNTAVSGEIVWLDPLTVALAVEVVSKGSERTDRRVKPDEYAEAGIPRYWRVETDGTVVMFRLDGDRYIQQDTVPLDDLLAGDPPPLD